MVSQLAEGAGGSEIWLVSNGALPGIVVAAAVGANRFSVTICRDMVKLLTVCALWGDNPTLERLNRYFYITKLPQLGNFVALWDIFQVNDEHG
jgi:hypothetical protein